MEVYVSLIISALVSLHQYIPDNAQGYEKYFSVASEMKQQDVLYAANQSCRYLYDLSQQAGVETLGEDSTLGTVASSLLGNSNGLAVMLDLIDTPLVYEKLSSNGVSPEKLHQLLGHLCAENFNPYFLPPTLASSVFDFIQNEVAVLSPSQLGSLGDFKYFGATQIYDSSRNLLDEYGNTKRKWVAYPNINKSVTLGLLATEDEQFFSHDGVSTRSVARILKEALTSDDASGGSTVTMQLLKNLFFLKGPKSSYSDLNQGRSAGILRKVREWYWAKLFERHYAQEDNYMNRKEQVLELYLNLVNFGRGIQGIEQAAQFYFEKPASDLSVPEAAYLTSLLKRPAFYAEPSNYGEWTKPRRDDYVLERIKMICGSAKSQERASGAVVLVDLCKATKMSSVKDEKFAELKASPLPNWKTKKQAREDSQPSRVQSSAAVAPFIAAAKRFVDNLLDDKPGRYRGLKVKTTVVPELQEIVQQITRQQLDRYDQNRQAREYLKPARDDRGRTANIRKDDLGTSFLYNINRFTRNQWSIESVLLYSVTLQFDRLERLSLTAKEIEQAISTLDENPVDIKAADVIKQVKAKSKQLGEILFVSLSASKGIEVLTIEDIIEKMDFEPGLSKEFRRYYSPESTRERLLKNAMARLFKVRPRINFEVLVRTASGQVLNSELHPVSLGNSDTWWAMHLAKRKLTFYWATPRASSNSSSTPRYTLQTPRLQAAVLVVNSNTGEVLANFAGYEARSSVYDRSYLMQRPVGSSLKPWTYFWALDNGLNPNDLLQNRGVFFCHSGKRGNQENPMVMICDPKKPRYYRPKNYSGTSPGYVTLEQGLIQSFNQATMHLLKHESWTGNPAWPLRLLEMKRMLEHIGIYERAEFRLPTMLGTQNSSLQKVVDSFTYFASGFQISKSYMVDSVEDELGRDLYKHEPEKTWIMRKKANSLFEIQMALAGVANRGTAWPLQNLARRLKNGALTSECFRGYPRPGEQSCFGGKTGTTDDGRDTWFTGFSKNFVIGVWVGYDDFKPIPGRATGSALALPIFQKIVEQGIDHLPPVESFVDSQNQGWSAGGLSPSAQMPQPALPEASNSAQPPPNFSPSSGPRCSCFLVTNPDGTEEYVITNPQAPSAVGPRYASRGVCIEEMQWLRSQGRLQCQ